MCLLKSISDVTSLMNIDEDNLRKDVLLPLWMLAPFLRVRRVRFIFVCLYRQFFLAIPVRCHPDPKPLRQMDRFKLFSLRATSSHTRTH